jgi:hypothetical protein
VKSLLLHKLRSVLTMLGNIYGVCSVIAMLAIGEGASYEAQQAIKKLGSQNIIVRSLKPPEDANVRLRALRSNTFDLRRRGTSIHHLVVRVPVPSFRRTSLRNAVSAGHRHLAGLPHIVSLGVAGGFPAPNRRAEPGQRLRADGGVGSARHTRTR